MGRIGSNERFVFKTGLSGPALGWLADRKGPRILYLVGFFSYLFGYGNLSRIYGRFAAESSATASSASSLIPVMLLSHALAGLGSCCAITAGVNAIARSCSAESVS